MYRLVFNIRSEKNFIPDKIVIFKCVNQIWVDSQRNGTKALNVIRSAIRPMGQLSSGLFLNCDAFDLNTNEDWLKLFKVNADEPLAFRYEFAAIAKNYVRVKFWAEGESINRYTFHSLVYYYMIKIQILESSESLIQTAHSSTDELLKNSHTYL